MLRDSHLSEEDILLVADGELSRKRARQARDHLAACRLCRSRLSELESTIAKFIALHHNTLDPQLSAATGSQALLKAQLAQASRLSTGRPRFFELLALQRPAAVICVLILAGTLAGVLLLQQSRAKGPVGSTTEMSLGSGITPNHKLTPGAVRTVSLGDVCSMPHEDVVRNVPSSLRQEVFKEYGIVNARPQDYEIDYLITPGLGGTDDIRNLWPEPSTSPVWNAHAKDALEERLHELVCDGQLDLPTAQQAIASDWVTAYKKYLPNAQDVSRMDPYIARYEGSLIILGVPAHS
ncbi:MAG TPA: hypothetical protein VMB49_08835 [Acidobacteriaceae bacterium]|nr:hypothetical protein [Acidobacteriaceae bacterium]